MARLAFEKHEQKYGHANTVMGESRQGLAASWRDMMTNVYVSVMRDARWPLVERARIWANTPADLQLATYVRIRPQLRQECAYQGIAFERLFPPPPGFTEPDLPRQQQKDFIPDIERQ